MPSKRKEYHDMVGRKVDPRLGQMRLAAHLGPESKKLLHKIERGVKHVKDKKT